MALKRIAVLGGGPAGLYFSYLWKKHHPEAHVELFEQNPEGATWGFGVVFSDRALDFLRADDPQTADLISSHMETWRDMSVTHRGETITIDGVGFSAIARLELLQLLQQQARSVGVVLHFETTIRSVDELAGFDLIVASDGINSIVRKTYEGDFKFSMNYLDAKFMWYGTTKRFETLSQTFVETPKGTFNAHHYRYSKSMSTFIVECDRATWLRYGFADMDAATTQAVCEGIFADSLDGHPLVSNKSTWRNFPWIWSERWFFKNMVLIGDALHTAHYSIGSGTRLAMEDVLGLVKALEEKPEDLSGALELYQAMRQPFVEKLVTAAKTSADWYEVFPEHMKLAPLDLVYSYITRSGRIDTERLRGMSPKFMAQYEAGRGTAA